MPTRTVQVPTFLGGISQQSPAIRRSNLVEDAKNVEFMATEGTIKRYPTQWLGEINTDLTGYKCWPMERDDSDYILCIGDGDVEVRDPVAGDIVVHDPDSVGYSYLAGASYEDLRVQVFSDTAFVLNRQKVVAGAAGKTNPSWYEDGEAGVFVRNSNYSTEYSITLQDSTMSSEVVCKYVTGGATFKRDRYSRGQLFSPTSQQQSGDAPFVFNELNDSGDTTDGIRANGTQELFFNSGGNQSGTNHPPTGGTYLSKNDFSYDPFTNEVRWIGSGNLPAGDLIIGNFDDIFISAFLQTNYIARQLIREIELKTTNIEIEHPDIEDSAFRVYTDNGVTLDKFEVRDSSGNDFMTGWTKSVQNISDLPLTFKHGAVVEITGADSNADNDYFVEFQTEDGVEGDWGQGTWNETVERGLASGRFDASTMPHTLQRKVATDGSIPGVAQGEVYFEWNQFDWAERLAGDETTNKTPSFVGEQIKDVFIVQNRLGFLAQTEVILSESDEFQNFWRPTVLNLADSDRMDFSASDLDGDVLQHAIPFNQNLLIFTELSQAVVLGDPIISPTSVQAPQISSYRCYRDVEPVNAGRSLFFAQPNGEYTAIREYVPGERGDQFQDAMITLAAPRLIPAAIDRLAVSTVDQMLAVVPTSRDKVYLYQHLRAGGEQIQASWTTWDFSGTLLDMVFMNGRLFVFLARDGATYLERMDIGPGRSESGQSFIPRLDSLYAMPTGTYDRGTDTTTYQAAIGYLFTDDEPMRLVASTGGDLPYGTPITITGQIGATRVLQAQGNLSGQPVLAGRPYEARLELSKPLAKIPRGGGETAVLDATQTVRQLHLWLEDTGYLKSTVEYIDEDSSEEEFLDGIIDVGSFDTDIIRSGEMWTGIHADVNDFRVVLSSLDVLPFNIINGAWDIRIETRHPIV